MSLNLPPAFLERMQEFLGDEYAAFLASYDHPANIGLRVNTLKITPEQFEAISPFPLNPIPWTSAGFLIPPDHHPGKHAYHTAGLYYLQDPAAMAVAELMAPQPGERVLDLAAAPGGKSTHIAALMSGEGLLVVNDLLKHRLRSLTRNLARWGARNTVVLNETPERLAEHFGPFFDRVLVDAPCSGEGMFRKDPAMRKVWIPKHIQEYAARQDLILQHAAGLVRPGGKLVYVTCTFSPEEDEGTLARFLGEHPDFEMAVQPQWDGFDPGRPEWLPGVNMPSLNRAVRLWPHKSLGEGHFIAVMERNQNGAAANSHPPQHPKSLPAEASSSIEYFFDHTLRWQVPTKKLALKGNQLYAVPDGCPNLHGLRVTQWGWWIGTVKKKRFEPAHGFGMGLRSVDFRQTLPLTAQDRETALYLRGDVLPSSGPDGWVMITVDGFPLGWGKRVQGRIKPRLPSWLHQF
ncbi:MAG: RsmB/NOP family class I SAM-dependent RNA methyltransferase [Chloroflexi bacterium]|nr:RsmB/NOP family class I SAM-dependent RNA methyltransferase [Chloroflexota bacterium]